MVARSKLIEEFLLDAVEVHPNEVARLASVEFGISRQAVGRYLNKLVNQGVIKAHGKTKGRSYELVKLVEERFIFEDVSHLEEDLVWRNNVSPTLEGVTTNILDICRYGITEMVNNVIDHSDSPNLMVSIIRDARWVTLQVLDRGVGIFKKIQQTFDLAEAREAVIELSKGKLTTDPNRHTGEGVFFTSQVFDRFVILSSGLAYIRTNEEDDWLVELEERNDEFRSPGTTVDMMIRYSTERTLQQVFDKYSDPETYAFTRTHVPLILARYEGDQLVSRSQAKRLLLRFERFNEVMLDFKGIETIGQAFADEIFRVFHLEHPDITIVAVNTTPAVDQMINRALSGLGP